jgi:hypothetical protein
MAVVVYRDKAVPTQKERVAWAAGIFEGEGCVTEMGGRFALVVKNTDEWVVRRFHAILGLGQVYGPYRNSEKDGHRRKPFWSWMAYEDDAFDAMQLLATWLSKRRLGRAYALTGLRFPVKRLPI